MAAYYNEWDEFAAAWLRALIAKNLIAPGDVDERSIADVQPDDLRGYTQAHWFAGIGGWSLACRLAGWPDDRAVWTGSCPCQPFSAAGKGLGTADERHLWPEFRRLIAECAPAVVFGEQVASRAGRDWLAGVRADLEALGYAVGAADLCAASLGAPHIRQRLWWVADAGCVDSAGWRDGRDVGNPTRGDQGASEERQRLRDAFDHSGAIRGLADADTPGQREQRRGGLLDGERPASGHDADGRGEVRGLADRSTDGRQQVGEDRPGGDERGGAEGRAAGLGLRGASGSGREGQRGRWQGRIAESGPWSDYVWIPCADGKARRLKPGIEPLAPGLSESLVRVRAIEAEGLSEVAAYGASNQRNPDEALRALRDALSPEACGKATSTGVLQQFHAAPVLFDFLLCLEAARHGAANRSGFEKASQEVRRRIVRGVRPEERVGCPPHQRQPYGQQPDQPADALLALSFILARHAEAHRASARSADAATSRVGRLRGYGNAIVPQVAAQFIEAVMACQP